MPFWWPFPVAAALIIAALTTPLVARFARLHGVVDAPDGARKLHAKATPLLCGVAIYFGFAIPTLIVLGVSDHVTSGEIDVRHVLGVLAGGLVLMVGGALDDRYNLRPKFAVIAPIIAACIVVAVGISVDKITNPLGGTIAIASSLSSVLVFVWILGMTYTTKILDGLDGLSGGVTAIGAAMIAALALSTAYFQPDVALLALIFLAAIIGFLLWNWHPARVFMGEGGSTFLGFTLGSLAVISGSKVATALLVMGIPALDVGIVIIRRLLARKHPFATADRLHVHHLLLRLRLNEGQAVIAYCAVALALGITGLMASSWQKIAVLGILAVVVSILVHHILKRL